MRCSSSSNPRLVLCSTCACPAVGWHLGIAVVMVIPLLLICIVDQSSATQYSLDPRNYVRFGKDKNTFTATSREPEPSLFSDDELRYWDGTADATILESRKMKRRRRRRIQRNPDQDDHDADERCVRRVSALSAAEGLPPLFWNEPVEVDESTRSREQKLLRLRKQQHAKKETATVDTAAPAVVGKDDAALALVLIDALTQPLIDEEVWHSLTGTEFCDHADVLLGPLAAMGERLAMNDDNNDDDAVSTSDWIQWNVHNPTEHQRSLEDGAVHLWIGHTQKRDKKYCGADLPFIKSRFLVPLSVSDVVDLLLDSSRIQTYNPYSTGRRDVWVRDRFTLICKNRVQPPVVGSKPLISTTLLHARPASTSLQQQQQQRHSSSGTSWVVVSRAVGGHHFAEPDDDDHRPAGHTHIYVGCNVLQPWGGDDDGESCVFTAVTHAYSSAVPHLMAERMGIKGALNFVKDLRKLEKVAAQ